MATKHPETTVIDLRKIKRGPGRPRNTWVTGTDPLTHAQYVAWARARAQAHYRKEAWIMLFGEWQAVWGDNWSRRGRGRNDLCMIRVDSELPWSVSNVELIPRRQHCQVNANIMKGLL